MKKQKRETSGASAAEKSESMDISRGEKGEASKKGKAKKETNKWQFVVALMEKSVKQVKTYQKREMQARMLTRRVNWARMEKETTTEAKMMKINVRLKFARVFFNVSVSQNTISLGGYPIKRCVSELVEVLSRKEARRLSVTKICNGTRKSLMEGSNLAEYIMAKVVKCLQEHTNCLKCFSLVNSAKIVLERR